MRRRRLLEATVDALPELTRDEAYAAIMCGEIYVNGERNRDPGADVGTEVQISRETARYVSRGGLKLEHALTHWEIDVTGKVMLDAGSSTGGFTDCLLQGGAAHVHAVDVGFNQLAYRLRSDPRVTVHEKTNVADLESLSPTADAAVADLSFRSVEGVARRLLQLSRERWAIVLVKPQFELRGQERGFRGVVRNEATLKTVLTAVIELLWQEKAYPMSIVRSPILGRRGNREFFFLLRDSIRVSRERLVDDLSRVI